MNLLTTRASSTRKPQLLNAVSLRLIILGTVISASTWRDASLVGIATMR